MGLFDLFQRVDINEQITAFRNTEGAVLLDVRTPGEYQAGHIEGSTLLPLDELSQVTAMIPEQDTPIFVYCLSGGRSGQGVQYLKRRGYQQVVNAGGIQSYRGKVVR